MYLYPMQNLRHRAAVFARAQGRIRARPQRIRSAYGFAIRWNNKNLVGSWNRLVDLAFIMHRFFN